MRKVWLFAENKYCSKNDLKKNGLWDIVIQGMLCSDIVRKDGTAGPMEKRILFLDLDGTLLNDSKQITPGNRAALNRALQAGHGVIITTGRPLRSAIAQARGLELDKPGCYLIAYNGAVIYDWAEQRQILRKTLTADVVRLVFEHVNALGIHIQTYDTWNVLVERRCEDEALRTYCGRTEMPWRVIGSIHEDLTEDPVKILLIELSDPKPLRKIQSWVREGLAGRADSFFSCDEYLEIVPAGVNKGAAVKLLCEMIGVPLENAVAVGDAANDLSMIRAAGVGVAMANATDEVRTAADYVTKNDNNHDGIAEVVEHFLGQSLG